MSNLNLKNSLKSALLAVSSTLFVASNALADAISPESGGSPNADDIDTLYKIVLTLAVIVLVAVIGTLIVFLFKYRESKGHQPYQTHGNTKVELGFTIFALLLVGVVGSIAFLKFDKIHTPEDSDTKALTASFQQTGLSTNNISDKNMTIEVTGQQYLWRYAYPGGVYSYEEMVVPVNTTVKLTIKATDVIHSWWIPKLGGKFDAVPGYTSKTWFKAPKTGLYKGQCAELCGRNHANMTAQVRVVSQAESVKWINMQKQSLKDANNKLQAAKTASDLPK